VIVLIRARDGDPDSYVSQLRGEMQGVLGSADPFKDAALAADAAITVAYQLVLSLGTAMADYAESAVTLDQILEWVQGKLEMHSGVAEAEQGGLDDLLGRDA
jgi:hypothetical protein